jgi:hypothetical protein
MGQQAEGPDTCFERIVNLYAVRHEAAPLMSVVWQAEPSTNALART